MRKLGIILLFCIVIVVAGLNITLPLAPGCDGPTLIIVVEPGPEFVPRLTRFILPADVFPVATLEFCVAVDWPNVIVPV